jgi:hypothetical protein
LSSHLGCDVLDLVGSDGDREDAPPATEPDPNLESDLDDTLRGLEELSDEEVGLALRNRLSGES